MSSIFRSGKQADPAAPFDRGHYYESVACRWLKKQKFKVLERNFRADDSEIDVIAKQKDLLCFIEVKARRANAAKHPLARIDRTKLFGIRRAAEIYLSRLRSMGVDLAPLAVRFDALTVEFDGEGQAVSVHHYPAYLEPSDADFRLTL